MDDFLVYLFIAGAIGFGIIMLILVFIEWRLQKLWKKLLQGFNGGVWMKIKQCCLTCEYYFMDRCFRDNSKVEPNEHCSNFRLRRGLRADHTLGLANILSYGGWRMILSNIFSLFTLTIPQIPEERLKLGIILIVLVIGIVWLWYCIDREREYRRERWGY